MSCKYLYLFNRYDWFLYSNIYRIIFCLVYKTILRKAIQNDHLLGLLINHGIIYQIKNNVVGVLKLSSDNSSQKCKSNSVDKLNYKEDPNKKPLRFAKEFINISSVRYRPMKTYIKCCPDTKPIYERSKCQMTYPKSGMCYPNDN